MKLVRAIDVAPRLEEGMYVYIMPRKKMRAAGAIYRTSSIEPESLTGVPFKLSQTAVRCFQRNDYIENKHFSNYTEVFARPSWVWVPSDFCVIDGDAKPILRPVYQLLRVKDEKIEHIFMSKTKENVDILKTKHEELEKDKDVKYIIIEFALTETTSSFGARNDEFVKGEW